MIEILKFKSRATEVDTSQLSLFFFCDTEKHILKAGDMKPSRCWGTIWSKRLMFDSLTRDSLTGDSLMTHRCHSSGNPGASRRPLYLHHIIRSVYDYSRGHWWHGALPRDNEVWWWGGYSKIILSPRLWKVVHFIVKDDTCSASHNFWSKTEN